MPYDTQQSPLTCDELDEDTLPRCEECGVEDDNLGSDGCCLECEQYSAPSGSQLYRWEGTW